MDFGVPEDKKLILFDGVCNLCNNSVNYVIKHDKKDVFMFSAFYWFTQLQVSFTHCLFYVSLIGYSFIRNLKQLIMKQLCLLFLLCASISFANNKNPTTSSVKAVTVFVDGAQVTRTAKIAIPIGTTEFTFTKLSSHIQENSIQISGLNDASIISIEL